MSCCKGGKQPPLQISNEVQLWMDMMKHMLECAELTMTAIKNARQKLKFADDDMVRFNELCLAVEKLKQQLVSVGESFLKSSDPESVGRTPNIIKPALIRRKNCCMQVDDDDSPFSSGRRRSNDTKIINFKKNACFCGKFKKKTINKSRERKIVVCSPAKNSVFLNQKCSRSFEFLKEEKISAVEPDKTPEDLPDDDNHPYIIKDAEKLSIPDQGIGYEFFCAMHRFSDRIAQYIDDTGEEQTFAELLRDCISVTLKLKEKNLGKDDVVCICVSNHKYSCVPYIAAAFAGCLINALDVNLSLSEIDYMLESVKPAIIFVQKEMLPLVEGSVQKTNIEVEIVVIGGDLEGYVSFEDYLSTSDDEISKFRPQKVDSSQETCIVLFTSGTTGDPKGVRLSHYSLLKQFFIALSSGNFQKVFLSFSSYYGIMTTIFLGASILGGISRVVASHFDPENIHRLIMKYKVGSAFLGPHECNRLTRTPKPEDADTSSLKVLATGGECLKASYLQKIRNVFPDTSVFQVYGQTETGGITLKWNNNVRQHVSLFNAKPASSGMSCGGMRYKIIEETSGKMLGPNQLGELCVKSDTIMEGYHTNVSPDKFDNSGWLKTGDLAYYDDYHCFYIMDKLTEIINVKGVSVSPTKLENVLMEHPAVEKAVVLGLPDSNDDEVPVGLIMLKPNMDPATIDLSEVQEFANKQVAAEESLQGGVRIIEKFPLTPTGKVRRKFLKESLLSKNELKESLPSENELKESLPNENELKESLPNENELNESLPSENKLKD